MWIYICKNKQAWFSSHCWSNPKVSWNSWQHLRLSCSQIDTTKNSTMPE